MRSRPYCYQKSTLLSFWWTQTLIHPLVQKIISYAICRQNVGTEYGDRIWGQNVGTDLY